VRWLSLNSSIKIANAPNNIRNRNPPKTINPKAYFDQKLTGTVAQAELPTKATIVKDVPRIRPLNLFFAEFTSWLLPDDIVIQQVSDHIPWRAGVDGLRTNALSEFHGKRMEMSSN